MSILCIAIQFKVKRRFLRNESLNLSRASLMKALALRAPSALGFEDLALFRTSASGLELQGLSFKA
jgi:hypothetical protein